MTDLSTIAGELGIAPWLFVIILVWSLMWNLLALWKSARNKQVVWFIVLALVNTVGILPILYIYVFSKMRSSPKRQKKAVKKKKRK